VEVHSLLHLSSCTHVLFSLPSDDDDDGRGDSDNVVDIFIIKAYRAY
jgi:hypothetical protein